MSKNIYIKALEIGVENLKNGISYTDMLKKLKVFDFTPKDDFEPYFCIWFHKYFFIHAVHNEVFKKYTEFTPKIEFLRKHKDINAIITGEAYQHYMDYVELNEARKSSKQANKNAKIAIIIAISALVISILFSILSLISNKDYSKKNYELHESTLDVINRLKKQRINNEKDTIEIKSIIKNSEGETVISDTLNN